MEFDESDTKKAELAPYNGAWNIYTTSLFAPVGAAGELRGWWIEFVRHTKPQMVIIVKRAIITVIVG